MKSTFCTRATALKKTPKNSLLLGKWGGGGEQQASKNFFNGSLVSQGMADLHILLV